MLHEACVGQPILAAAGFQPAGELKHAHLDQHHAWGMVYLPSSRRKMAKTPEPVFSRLLRCGNCAFELARFVKKRAALDTRVQTDFARRQTGSSGVFPRFLLAG
jgi:hypothetical protein